jgi:hypothetical protein
MVISFPRDIPEINGFQPFRALSFQPEFMQTRRTSRGAQPQVADLGSALWVAQMTSMELSHEAALELETWLQTLRGGSRLFKLWHPLRRYPKHYRDGFAGLSRAGGGSFDGTCTLNAIGAQRDTIELTTLPASFVFSNGDMVSYPIGASSRALHRVVEASTGSGGGVATIAIEPTVPLGVATAVTATLVKPYCLASVDAASIKASYQAGQSATVSFTAIQTY